MTRLTDGTGPQPCPYLLVSDYPGKVEAQTGEPLTGRTGDEVNRRLDGVKLPVREEWRIVNLIRQWNSANEYAHGDVVRDEPELLHELTETAPQIIVTLGRWSARYFLGDIDIDEVQALPWYLPHAWIAGHSAGIIGAERPVIFPIMNPAAGFRSPEVQSQVDFGFRELGLHFAGKTEPRELFEDAYLNPTYVDVLNDPALVRAMLHEATAIYIDTEGHPGRVWSLQFAFQPGTAYLIRVENVEALTAFFEALLQWKPRITYHGSLHDFGIIRELLVTCRLPVEALYDLKFDDTQIMAYLLQLEPIGLKPNCVRHCNMVMQDYTEVLGDAQLILSQDYLVRIFDIEQEKYVARQHAEFKAINRTPLVDTHGQPKRDKAGKIKMRRTTKLPAVPRTDLHKAALRVLGSATPFALWQDQREDIRVAAYNLEV